MTDKEKLNTALELLKELDQLLSDPDVTQSVLFYNLGIFTTKLALLTNPDAVGIDVD